MLGKNNIFSGVFRVIVMATLVFIVLFFFYPSISLKYFGTAFQANKAVAASLNSMVGDADYLTTEQKKAVSEYLASDEGKKAVSALAEAAKQGGDALDKALESEEMQRLQKEVSSKLTKENMEDFMGNLSSVTSDLFARFSK